MRKAIVFSMMSLFAAASPALAHDQGKKLSFTDLDANADGKVTREEFVQAKARKFDEADKNDDGRLEGEEKAGWRAEPGETLTREQMLEKAQKKFAKLDANGDGTLSQDEHAAHEKGHQHEQKSQGAHR